MTFLKTVAEYFKATTEQLENNCFVFPTRRAGLFFKNALAQIINKPVFAPAVYSIEDFMFLITRFNPASELELIFELFNCYRELVKSKQLKLDYPELSEIIIPQETFDTFYPWGELLVKDFNIIDKELVNPSEIFRVIRYEKELESKFAPEIAKELIEFWGLVFKSRNEAVSQNFLKLFDILNHLYSLFTFKLREKGIAYDGLVYRYTVEHMEEIFLGCGWDNIIFIGFNSLSKAEKKIIEYLLENRSSEIIFDADAYYLLDENHEAGFFLRENINYFTTHNPKNAEKILLLDNRENVIRLSELDIKEKLNVSAKLKNERKTVNIIGTTFNLGTAKVTGNELAFLMQNTEIVPEETAIVLADESLLFPLLYSIPKLVDEINVTMGVPFYTTPLYNLIILLKSLQEHKIKLKTGETKFYYKDIEKILIHSYIRFIDPYYYFKLITTIRDKNIVYLDFREHLIENLPNEPAEKAKDLIEKIFIPVDDVSSVIKYLNNILEYLLYEMELTSAQSQKDNRFKLQYFAVCLESLQELNSIIQKYEITLDINTYWNLLDQVLKNIRIPFVGEPVKGLQVMGFLETRCLDFKNVFIVPANENVFPKTRFDNSFIPYRLRKIFNLPTFDEADKIHSYYFYRLLQRAENIFLIYNTEVDEITKEKSRYILQLEYELAKVNPHLKLNKYIKVPPLVQLTPENIVVTKTEEIKRQLSNIESVSVTDVITYIKCPLKFFFTKIAGLPEEKEVEESYSAKTFGNIFHEIAEIIFKGYEKKEIQSSDLKEIEKLLKDDYNSLFAEAAKRLGIPYQDEHLSGRNYLYKMVILKLLQSVLKIDEQLVPYKLIALEYSLESILNLSNNKKIRLKARYDKLIQKDSQVIILDYKTGTLREYPQIISDNEKEEVFIERVFTRADHIALQAILYVITYGNTNQEKDVSNVTAAFYQLKGKKNLIYPLTTNPSNYLLKLSEEHIRSVLENIFVDNNNFCQTEDIKVCSTCRFQSLCHRD